MRFLQAVILLIFLGAIGIFAFQNTHIARVRFLDWHVSAPLAVLTIAVYFLGMLSGWTVVAFVSRTIRRMTERRRD